MDWKWALSTLCGSEGSVGLFVQKTQFLLCVSTWKGRLYAQIEVKLE